MTRTPLKLVPLLNFESFLEFTKVEDAIVIFSLKTTHRSRTGLHAIA